MPKLKENTIFPNLEEEVAINAGIASYPDTYELTAAEFAELKPFTIRLSPDVLEAFKSTGKGWQTRIDGVLKEWLNEHASS